MAERELSRRTQELWRPTPESLYPALRWLEDEGLVRSVTTDGRRRRFELTGLGFGLINPPITNTAVAGMPKAQAGMALACPTSSR